MSYKFTYVDKNGRSLDLEILDRDEYCKLDDDEKIEYSSQPEVEGTCELGVQSFIWSTIEECDSGDNGIPEVLDAFMKKHYPKVFDEWIEQFKIQDGITWTERTDYFWGFIDETGDEALDASDIYFLDHAYSSEFIYDSIIERCKLLSDGAESN